LFDDGEELAARCCWWWIDESDARLDVSDELDEGEHRSTPDDGESR
jgi:hypothetical protein